MSEVDEDTDVVIIDDLVPVPVSVIAADTSVVSAGTENTGVQSGEPRRKRRRGRRGGRRLRSADERANPDAEQDSDANSTDE